MCPNWDKNRLKMASNKAELFEKNLDKMLTQNNSRHINRHKNLAMTAQVEN